MNTNQLSPQEKAALAVLALAIEKQGRKPEQPEKPKVQTLASLIAKEAEEFDGKIIKHTEHSAEAGE